MPSLLVGMSVAKTLAMTLKKPYIAIDHIEDSYVCKLPWKRDKWYYIPFCVPNCFWRSQRTLHLENSVRAGENRGNARWFHAGEAFDKVAKMMGLGYPGWPIIGKLASEYTGSFRGIFPNVLLNKNEHSFSFSGLKSAVKREVDKRISMKSEQWRPKRDCLRIWTDCCKYTLIQALSMQRRCTISHR